ncbi:hypothetical protein J3R03_003069 [Actinoplanes couchii]|nr:hypothetical protein [Actinoplanes couchii]
MDAVVAGNSFGRRGCRRRRRSRRAGLGVVTGRSATGDRGGGVGAGWCGARASRRASSGSRRCQPGRMRSQSVSRAPPGWRRSTWSSPVGWLFGSVSGRAASRCCWRSEVEITPGYRTGWRPECGRHPGPGQAR